MLEQFILEQNNIGVSNKRVILTFITGEYCALLLNWYMHLKKIGLEKYVIVVCLDSVAYDFIKQQNISGLHIDSKEIIKNDNRETLLVKKAYIETHHICKALCFGYFIKKYNIDIIHSDIDMIFLKDPFQKLETIVTDNYDFGAYMDLSYEEMTLGKPLESEKGGFGFTIFYIKKSFYQKLIDHLATNPLLIDDNDVGINVLEQHYTNIKIRRLNSFLFTTYNIWNVDSVRNNIKNICYCIHYNTSENTWTTDMNKNKIDYRNNLKIERMKQYGHWLL